MRQVPEGAGRVVRAEFLKRSVQVGPDRADGHREPIRYFLVALASLALMQDPGFGRGEPAHGRGALGGWL